VAFCVFWAPLPVAFPGRLFSFAPTGGPVTLIPGGMPIAAGIALTALGEATASIPPDSARDLRAAHLPPPEPPP